MGCGLSSSTGPTSLVMNHRDKPRRVNVCWEVNGERKCETMNKDQAYALKAWLEDNNGFTYWFQALDD